MESQYIRALEIRSRWLRWAKEHGNNEWAAFDNLKAVNRKTGGEIEKNSPVFQSYVQALPAYIKALQAGDTYFMNKKFSSLVEHARLTIPDDLAFEHEWLQSKQGWLWIEEPFRVPEELAEGNDIIDKIEDGIKNLDLTGKVTMSQILNNINPELKIRDSKSREIKVAAIGWFPVPEGYQQGVGRVAGPGATEFLCYQDFSLYDKDAVGFGCWSYFMLQNGDKLIDRIHQFEAIATTEGGGYRNDRSSDMMHEIRWIYAAYYLMAQRLAVTFNRDTDRNTRRRAERENRPIPQFIRVVSLRKLEEDKKKDKSAGSVEWQWQWSVRGHWRNQYFPSTQEHKPVFIEAYIKGDSSKPLKPDGHTIFVARR